MTEQESAWRAQLGRLAAQLVENAARALDGRAWQRLIMVRIVCDRCGVKELLGLGDIEPVANPPGWTCFWIHSKRTWPVSLCPSCRAKAFAGWRCPPSFAMIEREPVNAEDVNIGGLKP